MGYLCEEEIGSDPELNLSLIIGAQYFNCCYGDSYINTGTTVGTVAAVLAAVFLILLTAFLLTYYYTQKSVKKITSQ